MAAGEAFEVHQSPIPTVPLQCGSLWAKHVAIELGVQQSGFLGLERSRYAEPGLVAVKNLGSFDVRHRSTLVLTLKFAIRWEDVQVQQPPVHIRPVTGGS